MPLTIDEVITDGSAVSALVKKIVSSVQAMPKPPAAVSAEAWGKLVAEIAPELGLLVDTIRQDIAD